MYVLQARIDRVAFLRVSSAMRANSSASPWVLTHGDGLQHRLGLLGRPLRSADHALTAARSDTIS